MRWRFEPDLSVDLAFWKALGLRYPHRVGPPNRAALHYLESIENSVLTLHIVKKRARRFHQPLELDGVFSGRQLGHVVAFSAAHVSKERARVAPVVELDMVGDAPLFFDDEVAFLDYWSLFALRGVHNLADLEAQFFGVIERYVAACGIKAFYVPVVPAGRRIDSEVTFTEQEAYWRFCTSRGFRRASYDTLAKRLNGLDEDGLVPKPMTFANDWPFCSSEPETAQDGHGRSSERTTWPKPR